VRCPIVRVDDLTAAIAAAKARTPMGGVILLSPGAPSFDHFRDYAERGRRFADQGSFDGASITGIDGLGIH
jgi:UDP-N-acetylmuramoylalanine--D-glutamate ligase